MLNRSRQIGCQQVAAQRHAQAAVPDSHKLLDSGASGSVIGGCVVGGLGRSQVKPQICELGARTRRLGLILQILLGAAQGDVDRGIP